LERLVERRKHKRFRMQNSAFVVFGSHAGELGWIIDISRGGLGFRYIAYGDRPNGSSELVIYSADKSFYLEKLPFRTVWDFEVADQFPSSPMTMRRRGVQIGELTQEQIAQLPYFIKNHTTILEMRRSRGDRRQVYDLDYFLNGWDERRSGKEQRGDLLRIKNP
jgi:hypothetical protein